MKTRGLDFTDVKLYAVTIGLKNTAVLLQKVDQLLAGGVDAIQLRSYELTDREQFLVGQEIKKRCDAAGVYFIVNNRVDLAVALDADGIHIGHTDLPIAEVRKVFGHRKIIGASTHSLLQAIEAQRAGADYVSCGPVWGTPTKPDYEAVGLNLIGLYKAALHIPFVAIGGIDEKNLQQALNAGAERVAVVRALFDASDPKAAALRMKATLEASLVA